MVVLVVVVDALGIWLHKEFKKFFLPEMFCKPFFHVSHVMYQICKLYGLKLHAYNFIFRTNLHFRLLQTRKIQQRKILLAKRQDGRNEKAVVCA